MAEGEDVITAVQADAPVQKPTQISLTIVFDGISTNHGSFYHTIRHQRFALAAQRLHRARSFESRANTALRQEKTALKVLVFGSRSDRITVILQDQVDLAFGDSCPPPTPANDEPAQASPATNTKRTPSRLSQDTSSWCLGRPRQEAPRAKGHDWPISAYCPLTAVSERIGRLLCLNNQVLLDLSDPTFPRQYFYRLQAYAEI